jgi:HEAT repeat protein
VFFREVFMSLGKVFLCVFWPLSTGYCQIDRVGELIAELKAPDSAVRMKVMANGLRKFTAPGWNTPPLKGDPFWLNRRNAAEALGELRDPRAVEPLIAALMESRREVRDRAVGALRKIGAAAVEPLIAALKDPDPDLRFDAARVLEGRREPRVISAFLTALRNRDLAVVAGAYQTFIRKGDPGSEDALIKALDHFGYDEMARDLLNCGNAKLENAAADWLWKKGVMVMRVFVAGGGNHAWGSGK